MAKKKEAEEVKEVVEPASTPTEVEKAPGLIGFSTQKFEVSELLNSKGIGPVGASGNPMTFFYDPKDSGRISEILKESGVTA